MSMDEFVHLLLRQQDANRPHAPVVAWGHIASYDPTTHTVKAVLPAYRNTSDVPIVTPWIPLGTLWVGNGWGIQIAPHGGASYTDPTAGEQCCVLLVDDQSSASMCAVLFSTALMPPPAPSLQPGECMVRHESGTQLYFAASGDLYVTAGTGKNLHLQTSGGGQVLINSG
jgi:hypothetical protein